MISDKKAMTKDELLEKENADLRKWKEEAKPFLKSRLTELAVELSVKKYNCKEENRDTSIEPRCVQFKKEIETLQELLED